MNKELVESQSKTFCNRHPRLILTALTLGTTALGTWLFVEVVAGDGLSLVDIPLAALFLTLFLWVSFSFWTATLGWVAVMRRSKQQQSALEALSDLDQLPRTAVLMPIYNEDPGSVFAGVRAMVRSLQESGTARLFDMFILSDTTNPDVWLEEERAWAKLVTELPGDVQVFYRHREKNVSRKAGNIADFCTRWGEHYPYMIVLDADSVMTAETWVEMVRRMEQDPEIGILQVPPTPVNRQSFFARLQQFAARVYGPVFLEGFALWSQSDGNYWGHNAIIRIQPFMEHCELPVLPGDGPMGGEILSHDFVEAALIRRAGWKVCLAHDLDSSYEECPTTMLDYAKRDQRWCQGNMQHSNLLLADGFHPASRLHLGMGVMSYLASPLWLLFLVLTVLGAVASEGWFDSSAPVAGAAFLFTATMAMLLLPKLWGVIALSRRPQGVAGHGGWKRAIASVFIETLTSILIAPIMMMLHTRFVLSTLLGHKVGWNAQPRDDRGVSLRDAWMVHYPHMLAGLAVGLIVWLLVPGLLPWLLPVLLGLVLSVPLSMLLGSVSAGQRLARWKLLLIPEEIELPLLLQWQRDARARVQTASLNLFNSVLYDPAFYALHVGILRATDTDVAMPTQRLEGVVQVLGQAGAAEIAADDRRAVLNDPRALERLHVHARSHLAPVRSALLA